MTGFSDRFTIIPDAGTTQLKCFRCPSGSDTWDVGYHPTLDRLNEQARAHDLAHHPEPASKRMWKVYEAALREAEEAWWDGDIPPIVTAVAKAAGLDPVELHDRIEAQLGWESHDAGYEYTTWFTAWQMRGCPDWEPAPGSADGNQQMAGT